MAASGVFHERKRLIESQNREINEIINYLRGYAITLEECIFIGDIEESTRILHEIYILLEKISRYTKYSKQKEDILEVLYKISGYTENMTEPKFFKAYKTECLDTINKYISQYETKQEQVQASKNTSNIKRKFNIIGKVSGELLTPLVDKTPTVINSHVDKTSKIISFQDNKKKLVSELEQLNKSKITNIYDIYAVLSDTRDILNDHKLDATEQDVHAKIFELITEISSKNINYNINNDDEKRHCDLIKNIIEEIELISGISVNLDLMNTDDDEITARRLSEEQKQEYVRPEYIINYGDYSDDIPEYLLDS